MQTAIYMKETTQLNDLGQLLDVLERTEESYFIASDTKHLGTVPHTSLAVISFYHLRHFPNGSVIFLNENDFNQRAAFTTAQKILLAERSRLIHINTKLLNSNTIIFVKDKNNRIRKIKNAELQSIIP